MNVFLDTNVVMEFLTQRKLYKTVRKIIRGAEMGQLTACISTISLSTIAYLLGLKLKEKGIHEPEKREKIRSLLLDMEEDLIVVDLSQEKSKEALMDEDFKDLEDSFQYYCAVENECDCIVTINTKDFPAKDNGLKVYDPKSFVDTFME